MTSSRPPGRALLLGALALLLAPGCGAGDPPATPADAAADRARADGPGGLEATAGDLPLPQEGGGGADARPDAPPPCAAPAAGAADAALFSWLLGCLRSSASATDKQAAIALFVGQLEQGGGLPITQGAQATFVYVRSATYDAEDDQGSSAEDFALSRRRAPIRVAGTFNGWKPDQHTLTEEDGGVFHATLTLKDPADQRVAYKFVASDGGGGDVWFSDPLSRRFGFDDNGRYSLVRGGKTAAGTPAGHLEWIRAVSATRLGNSRPVYLYLPPGYEPATTSRYPALYMQDGQNLFDAALAGAAGSWDLDRVADEEINAGRALPFIAVGVSNTADRFDEYTHTPDTITLGGAPLTVGGKGGDYLHFVVKELKPLMDARYRTRPGKAYTAIMGSSLGGLIAYYGGYLYPDVFRYVGGMSSTFGWGSIGQHNATMEDLYRKVSGLSGRGLVYYLDSGDNPQSSANPPSCPTPAGAAEDNYCETMSFRSLLVSRGVDTFPDDPSAYPLTPAGINICHYYQPDGAHNEAAWSARLFRPLRLFFQP